jgi:hypothetical protein
MRVALTKCSSCTFIAVVSAQISLNFSIPKNMGSHNAVKHKQLLDFFLGGPDDDLIRPKHVALTSILFYGI